MNRCRILSIEGGGIKGVFPVSLLAEIESALGIDSVANYSDLIAGTSVGGIIALGLGIGLTARKMADFFVSEGPKIFPRYLIPSLIRLLFTGRDRYRPEHLRKALENVFKSRTLSESRVRLLIPAFDATNADIHMVVGMPEAHGLKDMMISFSL
jgi:uncharacterized protein